LRAVLRRPIFIDQPRAAAVALSRQATRGTRALGARFRDAPGRYPQCPMGTASRRVRRQCWPCPEQFFVF
jgi:hypothetical protein